MAVPFKNGADLYNNEVFRMRLHNLGADPTEVGAGLIYFNTSDGLNTSKRARIYDGTTFRSLAFLDEIANNEAFNALVGRVDEVEGDIDSLEGRTDALEALFSGSNAKVADNALMLGGQLPSYYAQSSVLAQLRSEFDALYKTLNDDTTGVIDTWQEVVDFVNEYSGSEDLSTILAGMNTQIADRYTKAEADGRFLKLTGGELKITSGDAFKINRTNGNPYISFWNDTNILGRIGFDISTGQPLAVVLGVAETLLHSGNYADQIGDYYLKTSGGTINGKLTISHNVKGDAIPLEIQTLAVASVLRIRTASSLVYFGYSQNKGLFVTNDGGWSSEYRILHEGNYSDLITTLNKTLSVPSITIGGINLSVVDGRLQIDGNAYATGELAAGGAGEEGSDDMGLALLENWADYDATKAQALGAVLGKDMYDRIVTLEGKSTNVQFTPTLSSGKQIGAITIDGVTTNLFAPSSYAWSKIDGRPTSLSQFTDDVVAGNYLPLSGGTINGDLNINSQTDTTKRPLLIWYYASDRKNRGAMSVTENNVQLDYYSPTDEAYYYIRIGRDGLKYSANYNEKDILHSGNVGDYAALKDGSNASGTWGIDISGSAFGIVTNKKYNAAGLTEIKANQIIYCNTILGSTEGMFPALENYSNAVLTINRHPDSLNGSQLGFSNNGNLYYRNAIDTTTSWKTIAFTDSDITGNAATATALKDTTAFTAWGQTFFENGKPKNIVGSLAFNANQKISWHGDVNNYYITSDPFSDGLDPSIIYKGFGGHVFKTNSSTTRLLINPSGNVTIGASDLAGSDYKLYVSGKGLFTNTITANAGINLANRTYIRGMLTDGTTNASLLGINQSDGFLVGYGVKTAAQTSVYGKVITMHANGEVASLRLNEYGNVTLGASTDKASDTYGLYVDKALPSYFANRVLIGGAEDEADVSLKVKGQSSFTSVYTYSNVFNYSADKSSRLSKTWADDIVRIYACNFDGSVPKNMYLGDYNGNCLNLVDGNRVLIGTTTDGGQKLQVDGVIKTTGGVCFKWGDYFDESGNFVLNQGSSWSVGDETNNFLRVIKSSGNVGIGTPNPDEKLHVVGNLHVTGNIIADGEVSAGGAGEEGETESTGNASAWAQTFTPTNTTMPFEHNRATTDVIVQVYEKNDGGSWDMILVDVEIISETKVNLHFGRTENREHKIVIMG